MNAWIQGWLEPATGSEVEQVSLIPTAVGWATMAVVAVGVAISWFLFGARPVPKEAPASRNFFTVMARNDLFGDTINDVLVVQPTMLAAKGAVIADHTLIDGSVAAIGSGFTRLSALARKAQTGQIRTYALTMTLGVVLVGVVLILSQLG